MDHPAKKPAKVREIKSAQKFVLLNVHVQRVIQWTKKPKNVSKSVQLHSPIVALEAFGTSVVHLVKKRVKIQEAKFVPLYVYLNVHALGDT